MNIKFWGVRGSIATPLSSPQLKSRISAVVQRIQPEDLRSQETREAFLSRLPLYLFGTVGGNTTCIELDFGEKHAIIIDAGTGIRDLGHYLLKEKPHIKNFHIFLTHFHWDHIQGIPFFPPAFNKKNKIIFYSPEENFETFIRNQMGYPYFPIDMNAMAAEFRFRRLEGPDLGIDDIKISWKKMKHPGGSYAYKFSQWGKDILIATDSEVTENEFENNRENNRFFSGLDMLVLDSQYTLEESFAKIDWGHSSYSMGVDLASTWKVKKLVLFHHEPLYSDRKILSIERNARWYSNHQEYKDIEVYVAIEGMELSL